MEKSKKILWLLLAVNITAIIISISQYYFHQLSTAIQKNVLLLPFIPDCPLATLMVISSIFLIYYFKKKIHWFYFLAFSFALKSALWTILVTVFFSPFPLIETGTLLILTAHAGLLAESMLLVPQLKTKNKHQLIPIGWLFLNDLMDYFAGTHPPVFHAKISEIFALSLILSGFSIALTMLLARKKMAPANLEKFFKKIGKK